MIARFSPSGEMLWRKFIINQSHGGQGDFCYVRNMKMVGDSSIMWQLSSLRLICIIRIEQPII
ncbi:MAG: hypothetical protein MJZ77_04915 [Bacteroidales bacterium]|nr:hypothetical protein [Bacteroidales bacterium]